MNLMLLAPFVRKIIQRNASIQKKCEKRLEPVGTEDNIMFASTIDLKEISVKTVKTTRID